MEIALFFEHYFTWHYSRALNAIVGIAHNFIWFLYHFFSVPILLKTFFSPWRRLNEEYRGGFNVEAIFSSFVVNTMMRIVGVLIRAVTLFVAFFVLCVSILLSASFLVIWCFLPFLVALLVYQGFHELFTTV
ncbi:MAG: hypothetical protein PHS53_04675 [Candidatus Pacebacteria bacterium]|nr:hypothetical protein [Candidatus Paceibacterota bacterium]